MSFASVQLMLFALAAATLAAPLHGAARLWLILVASLVFAATYMPGPLAALPLVLFVLLGYGATLLVAAGRGRAAMAVLVAAIVAIFVWLKRYPFVEAVPALPFPYVLVGLSYILFRMLHVVFEVRNGTFPPPSFPRYLAYLIFFPAFLSGPINHYPPFARDLDAPQKLDSEAAFQTLARFLLGYAKVAVGGEILLLVHGALAARLDGVEGATLALLHAAATGLYLVYLYVNFSGYTDMAIALGRLLGIVLPENFDRPFLANNFQDFWSRWHITLSEWFKIYFFNPLMMGLMRRWPQRRLEPYLSAFALFVVFLVLGAWHGASWEYMLVGFMLATGVAVNKLWQTELGKRLGKPRYRALQARPLYIWAARGLTLAWVAAALTTFWIEIEGAARLLARLGPLWAAVSLVLLSAAFAIAVWAGTKLLALLPARPEHRPRPALRVAALGATVAALAFLVPVLNSAGDFVYQAF